MAGPTDTNKGTVVLFDDFLGDLLWDEYQTSTDCAMCVGTTVSIVACVTDGIARIATCTADNQMGELASNLQWRVQDGMLAIEGRIRMSAITSVAVNFGFNDDALDDSNSLPVEIGACNALTTNAASFVGFAFDVDGCPDVWYGVAVDDNNDNGLAPLSLTDAPVAATYQTLRVVLTDRGACNMAHARFYINGQFRGEITNAIDRDVALSPYFAVESRAACAARNIDLDYWEVTKTRAPAS